MLKTSGKPDDDGPFSHLEQRITLSRRLKRFVFWWCLEMILEPPFHAHVEISVFTLPHSPTTAGNKVGIRTPDTRWRECDKCSPAFPPHFVLQNCCASLSRRLYSPQPSTFGHKITPCQHLPTCIALFKAAISNSFISPHDAQVAIRKVTEEEVTLTLTSEKYIIIDPMKNYDVRIRYNTLSNRKLLFRNKFR
jgi:hypothetical protein